MEHLVLQPEERLLRKDAVSLVGKKLVTRTGFCYLTNQRLIVDSEPLLAGAAGTVSIVARSVLRKVGQLRARRDEIALRQLTRVSLSRYGVNRAVDIPLGNGETLRLVMNTRQRKEWLAALDEALRGQGLQRVAEDEGIWRVRPTD